MFDQLMPHLQKPALWQRSDTPFWDDEHISKSMLEAHLDPDRDAASRMHDTIECSVKWLSSIMPAGGKVLDLGCGPGLYTKRLSELGYDMTGMDFSCRSIAYAKEHDTKTRYICQDYLELDFTGVFDAITLIYGDFAALIPTERVILLEKVHRALKPGGLFIFDVFTDTHFKSKSENKIWSVHENGGFWSGDPHLCLEAAYLYENSTVSVDQTIVMSAGYLVEYLIWDTAYTRQRLADEVMPADFRLQEAYDDICGTPYTGEADTLCFVLEKSV